MDKLQSQHVENLYDNKHNSFYGRFFTILSQGSFVFYMFPNFYQFYASEIYYGTSFSYRLHFLDFDSYKVQDMQFR